MHAENMSDQETALNLYQQAYDEEPVESIFKKPLLAGVEFSKRHLVIIKQFGRFPHRNTILGRSSSDAEVLYLNNGGDRF